jgi:hypothetical protein
MGRWVENPKLTIWEIILWMQKDPTRIYHNDDLRHEYGITKQNASLRLVRLRNGGYIKYADITRKWPGGYILTERGINYIFFTQKDKDDAQEETVN